MYTTCLLLIISVQLAYCIKDGLYSTEDDDVMPLNETLFPIVVKNNSDIIWVVEFYNSWCGHCIHFAPTWKKVAVDIKDWRDLVVVAAIDCTQKVNLQTCRTYDIDAYPTLKIFPPTSVASAQIQEIRSQDLQFIKQAILEYMIKYSPSSWPRLQPLEKIEDIWLDKKDNHEHVLLIFEENNSPVGSQVIIDVRNVSSVLVRRMLQDNVLKYGISKFPSLYKVSPDSTYQMMAIGNNMNAEDRIAFVQTIKALTDEHVVGKSLGESKKLSIVKKPSLQFMSRKYNSSVVRMQDLESALHYSFRQEIAIKNVIDHEKLGPLKKFVKIISKYFPGRKPIMGFLHKVSDMLNDLVTADLSGQDWMDKINNLQDKDNFLPEVIKWESCQGSAPQYRGYPCSMWTLFHTLTVGAYNQEIGARHSNPQEVLVAIRGYMKHFFGCKECAMHFYGMAEFVESEIHSQKDSVLWLWSAHNKVNKRLHGTITEDPEHLKIEFPPAQMCPKCHTMSADVNSKQSWDTENVIEFLVSFYSEKHIVSSDELQDFYVASKILSNTSPIESDWWVKNLPEKDLTQFIQLQENKRKLNKYPNNEILDSNKFSYYEKGSQKQNENHVLRLLGLNNVDFSLCVVFYLISTMIIITLYHHFIVRRRMMPCRNVASKISL